jgi:nucleoside-diphosphate-sugar epimerase
VKPPVLLTGATGFLGMEVLARLLEQGDRAVRAVIRAPDQATADARLDAVLAGLWHDPRPFRERVEAIPGDLTRAGLGLARPLGDVGAVLHCAASISFSLPLAEARAVNVEGTRRVIELARRLPGLQRFVHVSTAYVAGMHDGTFGEDDREAGQAFRNTYEQSKWEAEAIVAAAEDLAPVIARPSIVVGESDTGWTSAFNVLYWPLRALARGLFDAIPADPGARLDVVPVDFVADALVHLLDRRDTGVVNLVAGHEAPTVQELRDLACDHFAIPRPPIVPPGAGGGSATDQQGAVYVPYFDVEVVFDDARARRVLHPEGIRAPRLPAYFGRLMEYAEAARWGKGGINREAARDRSSAPA